MKHIIDGEFLSILEGRDLRVAKSIGGAFGGNRQSFSYGTSSEFAEFRDYFPGDDLRFIDWNSYARFDKLFIKLFTDERQLHHHIYLDASASMDWGKPSKADMALRLICAISYLAVAASDRVCLNILNKNECKEFTRRFNDKDSFYEAAEKLNEIKFYGDTDINAAIQNTEKLGYGDGISFLISDFLTDSDWKNAISRILYKKRDVCLIQILSPDEISPSLSGKLRMLDSEADSIEDIRNYKTQITRSSLKAYEKAFLWHQNDIKTFCASRKIRFISICSDEPIEKVLFKKSVEEGLII